MASEGSPQNVCKSVKACKAFKQSLKSKDEKQDGTQLNDQPLIVVIFGASGHLSRIKIYPTFWLLFKANLLPSNIHFIGYARSKLSIPKIREMCKPFMKIQKEEESKCEEFWSLNDYMSGQYHMEEDLEKLNKKISEFERGPVANRLFYLALPAYVYEAISTSISKTCMGKKGWNRIIIEKPFGKDLPSSQKLSNHLGSLFSQDQMYHLDHYLGKEMLLNLFTFRFANRIFGPTWNRDNIASVQISFNENFGIQGRGGYFDQSGMIRDVMQNHMLQMLILIAMERPPSRKVDDIREEKVKLLKRILPLVLTDVVLGQYVADPEGEGEAKIGYLDDPSVPNDSLSATFAVAVLRIKNERWDGVPFILKCGKGINERTSEIIIQYKDVCGGLFDKDPIRNELYIRVQPGEAIFVKLMVKSPGMTSDMQEADLELTYGDRYPDAKLPGAYEKLLLDVLTGSQVNFVSAYELNESWRIFTPLLNQIENEKIKPIFYKFGSTGPKEADELIKANNFYTGSYNRYKPALEQQQQFDI